MGSIGSAEGVSFGGVIKEATPSVRGGVIMLFMLVAGVIAPGILPKDGPAAGARGSLGMVVPGKAEGFVPKRGAGTTLEFIAAGASVPASGLGI